MTSVVILHQHFVTPQEGGTLRLWHIANAFARAGYKVTVIAGNSSTKQISITVPEGLFSLVRLPVAYDSSLGEGDRIVKFLKFAALANHYLLQAPKPDFIYASSTPLTVALPAILMKELKHIPYFLELRDMWPTVPIEMGFLASPFKRWAALSLEKHAHKKAEGIIVLSPEIQERSKQLAPGTPNILVPNFSDTSFYAPKSDRENEKVVKVVYAGSLGLANGIDRLIEFSTRWNNYKPNSHHLEIYGSGPMMENLLNWVKHKPWITLKGKADRLAVKEAFNESNFSFVGFADFPSLKSCSPNKFFDSLAAGLPVITNMEGMIGDLVVNEAVGLKITDDFQDFDLLSDTQKRSNWAANARALAENQFAVEKATQKILRFIEQYL